MLFIAGIAHYKTNVPLKIIFIITFLIMRVIQADFNYFNNK